MLPFVFPFHELNAKIYETTILILVVSDMIELNY